MALKDLANVTVYGSIYDIHDNKISGGNFHLADPGKQQQPIAAPQEQQPLHITNEMLRPYIKAGFVTEDLKPAEGLSNGEVATLARHIAERYKIENFWAVFESFWKVNLLRAYYNKYKNTKKFKIFFESLNKVK